MKQITIKEGVEQSTEEKLEVIRLKINEIITWIEKNEKNR